MENKLLRFADLSEIETREIGEEKSMETEGLACVFNRKTSLGWFDEIISERAFDECDMSKCVLLFNHDQNYLLAGIKNGSLDLEVTPNGLLQRSRIVGTDIGKNVYKLVKEGLIDKMSFAFTVAEGGESWEEQENGTYLRTIHKIDKLFDVSLVTMPAYEQTIAFARSQARDDKTMQEKLLRAKQDEKMKGLLNNGK